MLHSLQAQLTERFEKDPDSKAIAFYNNRGEFTWQTYRQFLGTSAGYAVQLANNGLSGGDVCIIVMPSGELPANLIVANLMLGAVPLLIAPPNIHGDAAYSGLQDVLNHTINKTNPRLVVCAESMIGLREKLGRAWPQTHFLFGAKDLSADATGKVGFRSRTETDIAAMQLTSGTTGLPRICVWKQKNIMAALQGMASAMQTSQTDICLNWTPLYHDMGLVNNFLFCLTNGIPLVMLNPQDFVKDPAIWLRALYDTGATITWSPNFGFAITAQRVRDEDIPGVRLDKVRAFWNAAERIHLETVLAFQKRFESFGVTLESMKTNFGCAENIGGATFSDPEGMFKYDKIDRALFQDKRIAQPVDKSAVNSNAIKVVGVGRPFHGMQIKILSDTGEPLPEGHIGEIALDTPSRMEGYLGDEQSTQNVIQDKLVVMGDLGYMRDGELYWVGRSRERITIRGKKLDPSDFEPILLKIEGLRHGNFAAFGVDEPQQGTQRLVIVSEVRQNNTRSRDEIIQEIHSETLMRLGINISDIVLVNPGTLTKTSSGKRRHRYFKELYLNEGLRDFEWQNSENNSLITTNG